MTVADWGGIVGGIAAILGALVAIWQAVSARNARDQAEKASRRADETAAALQRMAAAQESLALASRPSAWGDAKFLGGDAWSIRNTSGRAVVLLRVETSPAEAQPLLEVGGALPRVMPAGDILEFAARARLGLGFRIVTLFWHFADETEGSMHDSKRTLR
jgi:hypothetical protein